MCDKLIINGVNVIGCKHLDINYSFPNQSKCLATCTPYPECTCYDDCEDDPNCYYKQLKQSKKKDEINLQDEIEIKIRSGYDDRHFKPFHPFITETKDCVSYEQEYILNMSLFDFITIFAKLTDEDKKRFLSKSKIFIEVKDECKDCYYKEKTEAICNLLGVDDY